MGETLRSFGRWFVAWYRQQSLTLRLLLLLIPLLIGKIVDEVLKTGKNATGLPEWLIAGLAIATVLLISLVLHRARAADPLPPIDLDELEVRRTFSKAELKKIRLGLHNDIYGGVAPGSDEIDAIYAKNPRVGVALYDKNRGDYVAFATGWPLNDDAARRLIGGTTTENELTADDVLPAPDNAKANYVLVPAFGAAGENGSAERKLLGLKLNYEFRRTLRQNFFSSRRRFVTLIATGFSPDGRRWCRRMGMSEESSVEMPGDQERVPVFAKPISLADVE